LLVCFCHKAAVNNYIVNPLPEIGMEKERLYCVDQPVLILPSSHKNTGTSGAGDMEMKAEDFFLYLQRQHDDSPLYLFDQHFADRSPALFNDYCTPSVFPQPSEEKRDRCGAVLQLSSLDASGAHHVHGGEASDCGNVGHGSKTSVRAPEQEVDLFSLLGDARPNFRWLIIGGKRSGSTFHVDPNGTSAWNACIRGRKLWCAASCTCIDVLCWPAVLQACMHSWHPQDV
jgi:hypothetical protein